VDEREEEEEDLLGEGRRWRRILYVIQSRSSPNYLVAMAKSGFMVILARGLIVDFTE
jgi:hypothetical protein